MFDKIILSTGHGGRQHRNGSWRSWLRRLISGAFLLSLVAAAALVAGACGKESPPPAFPPATVLAAKVVKKDMPLAIAAIGTVEAHKSINVYPG